MPHDPEALALFLRGIAHEILNPLTSISGLAQLELGEAAEDTPRAQRHRTILREAERIQGVVRSLELFLRALAFALRLSGHIVKEAGKLAGVFYDVIIFAPLAIERWVVAARENGGKRSPARPRPALGKFAAADAEEGL